MKSQLAALLGLTAVCCLLGCAASGGGGGGPGAQEAAPDIAAGNHNGQPDGEDESQVRVLAVVSEAFVDQGPVPAEYAGDGGVSPPLSFEGVPAEAVELALTVVDPDAPGGEFVHWVIYTVPATAGGLPEGVPNEATPADPPGAVQGTNDFGNIGYGGPDPPGGETHRYVFTLYAVSEPVALEAGAERDELLAAIEGLIIAQAELTGTYSP
jgi:Raf kinase inhibitor-like YbhB/YbcL family protein